MHWGNQLEAPIFLLEQFVYCGFHKILPFLTTTGQTDTFHFLLNIQSDNMYFKWSPRFMDHLCGLVVEFLATDTEVSGSIPGATRFSE